MLSGGSAPFQPDILKDEDRWSGISNKDVGMREVALVAQRARQKMRRYAPTNTFSALLLSTGLLLYVLVGGTKPVQVDQPIPDPVRDFVEQPPHKFVVIAGNSSILSGCFPLIRSVSMLLMPHFGATCLCANFSRLRRKYET